MAQQALHHRNLHTGFQQVRGKAVPQRLPTLLMSSRRGRSITGIIRFADVRSK